MKKKLLLLGFTLIFSFSIQAQLLWEVSGNHLKSKSYLFGTHHLVPSSFLDSIHGIYPAFNECDNVVGEIIMDDPSLIKKLQQAALMSTDENIKNLLSEEQYYICDSILNNMIGLGLDQLHYFKPAMIENIFTVTLYEKYFPRDTDFQIDTYFQKVGKKKGKRLFSLETIEDQIQLLLGRKTVKEQALSLYKTLTSTDYLINQLNRLNDCYLRQDLNCLLEISQNDSITTEAERWDLNDSRNLRWSQQLPIQLKKGSNFIVVGALHLAGENGLIAQLKKQGYKVKPIK